MAKRLMSDAEMRRRQKLQGKIGRTTSTLGLGGAAIGGAALVAGKKPGSLKYIRKVPGLKKATHEGLSEAGLYTSLAAGGIGGVGGFNQASIYSAESRKRKAAAVKPKTPVTKAAPIEMGYYGDEGKPLTPKQIEAEIEKAWTPSASNYDSERDRKKRADTYSGAALVGAGAGAAYGGHHGVQAVRHARKIRTEHLAPVRTVPGTSATAGTAAKPATKKKAATAATAPTKGRAARISADVKNLKRAVPTEHLGPALRHGGKAALGVGVLAGAGAAGMHLRRKKSGDWQPYAKSGTSAFGVDHVEKGIGGLFRGAKKAVPAAEHFEDPFKPAKVYGKAKPYKNPNPHYGQPVMPDRPTQGAKNAFRQAQRHMGPPGSPRSR